MIQYCSMRIIASTTSRSLSRFPRTRTGMCRWMPYNLCRHASSIKSHSMGVVQYIISGADQALNLLSALDVAVYVHRTYTSDRSTGAE